MNRRFLIGMALGLVGVSIGARLLRKRRGGGSAVARVIERDLGFLRTRSEDREHFARDYARLHPMVVERLAERDHWSGARIEALEERICATFLLSSDFFWNGAEESKPVRYLALYNPEGGGCANPFARFDLD